MTVTISVGSDIVACNPHQSRFKMSSACLQSLQVCWLNVNEVDYNVDESEMTQKNTTAT